jgi:hypothetical protein
VEQAGAAGGDFGDGALEGVGIGLRRLAEAADLAHELQRGRVQFFGGRGLVGPAQYFYAPAHS